MRQYINTMIRKFTVSQYAFPPLPDHRQQDHRRVKQRARLSRYRGPKLEFIVRIQRFLKAPDEVVLPVCFFQRLLPTARTKSHHRTSFDSLERACPYGHAIGITVPKMPVLLRVIEFQRCNKSFLQKGNSENAYHSNAPPAPKR